MVGPGHVTLGLIAIGKRRIKLVLRLPGGSQNKTARAAPFVQTKTVKKKSRIRETPTLSTDADSRTDTNLKRLHELSVKKIKKIKNN